jgi:hypothetical protein
MKILKIRYVLKFCLTAVLVVSIVRFSCAQCLAKPEQLKLRQLSSQQTIFDYEHARQIESVLTYLQSKYNTPLRYYYVPNWDNACYLREDNHLYFGVPFLNELYRTGGFPAIAFFVCHEYAHFCQAIYPNGNNLVNGTVRVNELQADFIASYFMSELVRNNVVKFKEEVDMLSLAQAIYDTGDNGFTDPSHHGTWAERTFTLFFPESTELGYQRPGILSAILTLANRYYTQTGIVACGSAAPIPGGSPVLGGGLLYNSYSGEECVVGIDFKLYVIRHKAWGGVEYNTSCVAIGEIDYQGKQILNAADQGFGFYINMYPNVPYYPRRFFVYKKGVYTDETRNRSVSDLYWGTKNLSRP